MKKILSVFFLLFIIVVSAAVQAKNPIDYKCRFKNYKLWGKVQVVQNFADIKVKVVKSFPDLKVKVKENFADQCGEWMFVDTFGDIKVQFVEHFEDIKIKFVENFPGLH